MFEAPQKPHFEKPIGRIEPNTVAIGKRVAGVPLVRKQDWVRGIHYRLMLGPRHGGLLDQEIIDKQLAPEVDGNHGGGIRDIGGVDTPVLKFLQAATAAAGQCRCIKFDRSHSDLD